MATNPGGVPLQKSTQEREGVVIRFAGDSGDGMQLTGTRFTSESVLAGNDVGTLPDFPAEIRAPTGTLYGVSAFQVNFSNKNVYTPGDELDTLVCMNPAALKTNIADLKQNGILIVDPAEFSSANLRKAEYKENPLEGNSLDKYQVYKVEVTKMTTLALKDTGLPNRSVMRSRNFFALGVVSWLFNRPIEPTLEWIQQKFGKNPVVADATVLPSKVAIISVKTPTCLPRRMKSSPPRLHPASIAISLATQQPRWVLLLPHRRPDSRSSWAVIPLLRPAMCCTNWLSIKTTTSIRFKPKTKSLGSAQRWVLLLVGHSALRRRVVPA